MEPAFVCASDLFGEGEENDKEDDRFVERQHSFPDMVLTVREFMFHEVNANLLWPGSCIFAQWLMDHREIIQGRRILELGSGTGALAIFLRKAMSVDITTCDYNDSEITSNIDYNCKVNSVPPIHHIPHTWGEDFPVVDPPWDLVIASDILLYVKQYPNLIQTLKFLLRHYTGDQTSFICQDDSVILPKPCFLMSWRRRIPKADELLFFAGCADAGFAVKDFGSRIYCISLN